MNENVKKWAEKLDGRKYGNELTRDEEKKLKDLGLVVVFGASDDLCEFRGANLGRRRVLLSRNYFRG